MNRLFSPVLFSSLFILYLAACGHDGPRPIKYGSDACAHCRMTISDARFGTQLVSNKGRAYHFDDLQCMLAFVKNGQVPKSEVAEFYLPDFTGANALLPARQMFILKSESIKSPMRGDMAAFRDKARSEETRQELDAIEIQWDDLWK